MCAIKTYCRLFPLSLPQCVVRVCCIRSFGHFLTNLQGNVLHFNPEAGIFTSISQSEQDNLVQQAKAQSRMVSDNRQKNHVGAVLVNLCMSFWENLSI